MNISFIFDQLLLFFSVSATERVRAPASKMKDNDNRISFFIQVNIALIALIVKHNDAHKANHW